MKFSDLRSWHNLHVSGFKFEIDPLSGTVFINESGFITDEDDSERQTEKFLGGLNFNHYSAEKMAVLFTEMAKNLKEQHRLDHIAFEAKQKKADTAKKKRASKAKKSTTKKKAK